MNRSILIVICDFLLVSLLAFSTVDINNATDEGAERRVKVDIATNQIDPRQDLAGVMRLALDDERRERDRLLGELSRTRDTLTQTREAAGKHQSTLSEREKQLQDFQQQLLTKEQQTLRLQQQYASAQTNLQDLQLQLHSSTIHNQVSQERLAVMEAELRQRQEQARAMEQSLGQLAQSNQVALERAALTEAELRRQQQQVKAVEQSLGQLALSNQVSREKVVLTEAELGRQREQAKAMEQGLEQLAQSNKVVQAERERLATQLQVAEAEKRASADQVTKMQDEVKVVREEKARLTQHADKLADGVKVLAASSGELAKEIREYRPLAPNTIFSEFVTNRVQSRFDATRSMIFGIESNKRRTTETILVTDGTNICALTHVEDTPLTITTPGTEWEALTGTLQRGTALLPIKTLSFYLLDPRLVFMPLSEAEARQLGARVYRIAPDPFKFQDAVIVGAREGYYGECKFQIDLTTPQNVKLDRSFLKGIFGKFNPSRGDLVFSKTGDLLGVMANSTYCVMIHNFNAAGSIQFGPDIRAQHTAEILSRMDSLITGQALRLQ